MSGRRFDRWSAALVFAAALALYWATLAPTVYNLDSAELTTAAYTGGLAHPTGYPLYLLLGRAWSRLLPWGDVGWRMNLMSAILGAMTLAMSDRVLSRLGVGALSRISALGLLATSRFFWAMSLVAEVYTLHLALVTSLLLLLLRWREQPSPRATGALGLLLGLSLANHASTVLLVPGLAWLFLDAPPRHGVRTKFLLLGAGGLAVGMALYLYLPWLYLQQPEFNYLGIYDADGHFHALDLTRPLNLLWVISGRAFSPLIMGHSGRELLHQAASFGAELWRTTLGVGLVPGALGLRRLWLRDRPLALASVLMFAGHVGFFVGYRVVDKDTMYLPAYWIFSIWMGVGFQSLFDAIDAGTDLRPVHRSAGRWSLAALLLVAVAGALAWNLPLVDLSRDYSARDAGRLALHRLPPGALLIGGWTTVPPVEYLQLVEGERPDVTAINRFLISPSDLSRLLHRASRTRPVFIDRAPSRPLLGLEIEPAWPLFRVRPRPRSRGVPTPQGE